MHTNRTKSLPSLTRLLGAAMRGSMTNTNLLANDKTPRPVGDAAGASSREARRAQLSSGAANLHKRRHVGESFIQSILFLCGAISILTTIGIVIVLGNESLRFFLDWGWLNSNNTLVEAITETDTTLHLSSGGQGFTIDQVIKLDSEIMRVADVIDHDTLVVERAIEDTIAAAHNPRATVYIGEDVTLVEFLTHTKWIPQTGEFGILPLLTSTIVTSVIALMVAAPIGLGAAIYLSEYASPRTRSTLKPILEILAGIPTVVYGYFALTFMTPLLRAIFGQDTVQIYNMASAGLVMGIMIIPTISSMSEDALSAVPRSLREASYGLGATRFETTVRVLLPAALSGIIAAFILGISRAVGETMIVAIAAGAGPNFTLNPFESAETITGHIARISTGDLSYLSIDYNSLFALGLALFVMTLVLNIISGAITRRFREVYQ